MVRWSFLVPAVSSLTLAFGCGNGPTEPSSPGTSAPVSLSLSAPSDLVKVRETISFAVIGTFADGSARPVVARWTTDTPAVAVVDQRGNVNGVGSGRVNVIATVQAQTAMKSLRVVPDYAGRWTGLTVIVSCRMGDFRTCGRSFPIDTKGTLTLALSQDDAVVTGGLDVTYRVFTFLTDSVTTRVGNGTGTILEDGRLTLEGRLWTRLSDGRLVGESTLWNWMSAAEANGESVRGAFQELSFSFGGFPQYVGWEFGPLARVPPP